MPLAPPPCENIVVYDGECFFCKNYIRFINLKDALGNVTLINARDEAKVRALGLIPKDLNEGMAFISDNHYYFGADAIYHMALLSTSNSGFNRLNRIVFRHRYAAILLYPFLKAGRRIYLYMAGKNEIT